MAKIELEISDNVRESMLVGAIEGGSNDWYELGEEAQEIIAPYTKNGLIAVGMWDAIKDGKTIPIHNREEEGDKLGEINMQSIIEGEQLMADKSPSHFMNMYLLEDDAQTADVWFQYCVLKKIVYG